MKRVIIYIIGCLLGVSLTAQTTVGEPHVVIVKFERSFVENELKPQFSGKRAKKAMPAIKAKGVKALNKKHAVLNYCPVFVSDPRYVEREKEFGMDLYYRVEFSSDETPETVSQSFMNDAEVEYAEPNYMSAVIREPDDGAYRMQWGLDNPSLRSISIQAEAAWDITTGHPDVIVAIIDNCVESNHRDLVSNAWYNDFEIPDNGIDDDENGFIDDFYGWNFRDGNDNVGPDEANKHDVDESHGTHVAGIVGARTNNGLDVAGVAGGWGDQPGARLMLFRTGEEVQIEVNGEPQMQQQIIYGYEALKYAADNGAAIAQCSWGGDQMTQAQRTAVDYFMKYGGGTVMDGGLIVAGAGNNGSSKQFFPAALSGVLSVGAVAQDGTLPKFSNYGQWVRIFAPGDKIRSTFANNTTGEMSGTSMATPMVSGVAALVLSATLQYSKEDKDPSWLMQHLQENGYAWSSSNARMVNAEAALEPFKGANAGTANRAESNTQIFLNPATGQLTIANSAASTTQAYTLYNAIGRVIYEKQNPGQEETVDMNNLPSGLYLLGVRTNLGVYTKKIVKN
ncbi:MAG: S8 family peptidase [Bacteroidales bacterium]|jgi:subtilisin family serine protease|nr:S8 family peptidase [Bacteroidales bacterium]